MVLIQVHYQLNYSVVVSDNNNCPSVSTNFNVLEPLDINDNANVTNISCHNFNDASINLSVLVEQHRMLTVG